MIVSVIIPVFNAERFLEKAISSCLELAETGEVIIVDDKSTDRSMEIAESFKSKDHRVKIFSHPNNENRGTAASRNLGILNAQCDFIAFLDNDDFYLPNRFKKTMEVFNADKTLDGVYEAIGTWAYDDESLEAHNKRMKEAKQSGARLELTTLDMAVKPELLFEAVLFETHGWFHINGLTLKKSVFEKVGLFDETLIWNEDTEFFYRLSYFGRLAAGNLTEAVAMRGVYKGNRTLSPYGYERARFYNVHMWNKMFTFMLKNNLSTPANKYILMRYLDNINHRFVKREVNMKRKIIKGLNFLLALITHPKLIFKLF